MNRYRAFVLLCAAMAAFSMAPAVQAQPQGPEFKADDFAAIFRLLRSRMTPDIVTAPDAVTAVLQSPDNRVLIVNLYCEGGSHAQVVSARETLKDSAIEAGDALAACFAKVPNGRKMLEEGRLSADAVTDRRTIRESRRLLVTTELMPGFDGLICTDPQHVAYFTPLAVFRATGTLDVLQALYVSQESRTPPEQLVSEKMRTIAFVEEKPGGRPLAIYRGNILLTTMPAPDDMLVAVSRAGLWLLGMQEEAGSFIMSYSPSKQMAGSSERYDMAAHMRATRLMLQMYVLTKDEQFKAAYQRGRLFAMRSLRDEKREGLAYLYVEPEKKASAKSAEPDSEKQVIASALLLSTLCQEAASTQTNPTANGQMKYLSEYLCMLVAPDGHLYSTLDGARAKREPFLVRAEPYTEVLSAMTMMLQISPSERLRKTAVRVARMCSSFADPQMTEAFAEYYRLTQEKEYAGIVLSLGIMLSQQQIPEDKAEVPDYAFGFGDAKLPPDSRRSGEAICGLNAAYEVSRMLGKPRDEFALASQKAARFLINMQCRPENAFYLGQANVVLGGFRRRPEDLTLFLDQTTEAMRGLISAASITARAVQPPAVEQPSPRLPSMELTQP